MGGAHQCINLHPVFSLPEPLGTIKMSPSVPRGLGEKGSGALPDLQGILQHGSQVGASTQHVCFLKPLASRGLALPSPQPWHDAVS